MDLFEQLCAQHPTPVEDVKQEIKFAGLDAVELPSGLTPRQQEAASEDPGAGIRDGANLLAVALDDATQLSISESINILRMAYSEDDKKFGIVLRAKCSVVNSILNAKLRVAEESFRQQRFDRLPELIKLIQEEEKRLPARMLLEAVASSA